MLGSAERESAFRFDDPAGEVGIETFIVRSGDAAFHVPLTYRSGPLDGGRLVGELEHSVLGHRWVYDGPSDPVYVAVVSSVIVEGGRDVDMVLDDGTPVPRLEWWATATGSGAAPEQASGALQVARLLPARRARAAPRGWTRPGWVGVADRGGLARQPEALGPSDRRARRHSACRRPLTPRSRST